MSIDVSNDLTDAQKQDLSDKLEILMAKYGRFSGPDAKYFDGVADGLNHAYKLVNEIVDDYSIDC